jgi:hypothetical protein
LITAARTQTAISLERQKRAKEIWHMQLVTEKLQEKCSEDTQMGGKGFIQETSRIPLGFLTMHPKKQKYHCSYQPVHIQLTVDMLW